MAERSGSEAAPAVTGEAILEDIGPEDIGPEDIGKLNFETAIQALEEIVRQLESGEVGLEDSIEMYARGTDLKRHCEAKLKAASDRVEKIVVGPGGEATGVEPAEMD